MTIALPNPTHQPAGPKAAAAPPQPWINTPLLESRSLSALAGW